MRFLVFTISLALSGQTHAQKNSISEIRSLCNELTNESVTKIDGYKILKRKDQLLLHVRSTCEKLEHAFDNNNIDDASSDSLTKELNYIRDSWVQKMKFDEGLGIFDIIMMGASHQFSSLFLRYDVSHKKSEINLTPSIFWKQPIGRREIEFDRKAGELNIQPNFKWALLDELEIKGSAPKAHIKDLPTGNRWLLKWGDEVHTDVVASRIFSALGYNTDYTYYSRPGAMNLILGKTENNKKRTVSHFVKFIYNGYKINLSPFIKEVGRIDRALIKQNPELEPFKGQYFVNFNSAAIDARPKEELRLGGMLSGHLEYRHHQHLRGAILALVWLGVWDIKEINTLLSISMSPKGETKIMGSFSDLGISLGVKIHRFPRDIKAGLINEFSWDAISVNNNRVQLHSQINAIIDTYRTATYEDLRWMANQISQIGEVTLRHSLSFSGWPNYVQELYFNKLVERRRQILEAFQIEDLNPMTANRMYSYREGDRWLAKDGYLVEEPDLQAFPEGLLHDSGRFRGFGWK